MSDLARQISESTWIPKARRDSVLNVLGSGPTERDRRLLAFALGTGHVGAVEEWVLITRTVLSKDTKHRLTDELVQHALTVAGARSARPVALRQALEEIATCSDFDLPRARAVLLALGAGVSLAEAHGIYVSATRKAQKSSLPKSPPHLGGPMPEPSVFETVELAITLARLASGTCRRTARVSRSSDTGPRAALGASVDLRTKGELLDWQIPLRRQCESASLVSLSLHIDQES